MNHISFKATFEGLNSPVAKRLFERKTQQDSEHKVVFKKGNEFEQDTFELYKNSKKTAEYKTDMVNEKIFSYQRLMSIYNILKVKETENIV